MVRGVSYRHLRSFSVTEDFEPGGQQVYFAQMEYETRSAIERIWKELDSAERPDFDPIMSRFALLKMRKLAGVNGWDNVSFTCAVVGIQGIHLGN